MPIFEPYDSTSSFLNIHTISFPKRLAVITEPHILTFEGWPTLLAGGQERSLFEVVGELRKRGITFTLAYEEEGDLVYQYQDMGIQTFQILTRRITFTSRNAPISLWNFIVSLLRVLKHSQKQKNKWNLIYVNQYFDLPLAAICGLILQIPVVCHLRLAAPNYLSRQYRWGLNRCRLLICNSHFTARTYQRKGILVEKMVVIHNGVDTEEFSPPDDAELAKLAHRSMRYILCLGRISKDKGIETLIDGIALAMKNDVRLHLLVVGNPRGDHAATAEYHKYLQEYAREKLAGAVEFEPATPNVVAFYRQADLVVVSSEWEEPFGRVVIESMASGVPCLASRVGGIPEILNGDFEYLLVEPKDPDGLEKKILRFIDWRSEDPELGNLCRRMIENSFSSKVMCDKLNFWLLLIMRA